MTIHNHNTRGHNKIHANVVIHEFAKRCLRYNIIKTGNNSPSSVINKITTHRMGGFTTYIKVQLLQKYDSQCMLFNCLKMNLFGYTYKYTILVIKQK